MSVPITLPLWVLLLIGILALLSFVHHFLLPSMRWVFRMRANRVIDDVNQRLALRIPSFKLTKRDVLIDRLIYDPRVLAAVEAAASREQVPRDALMTNVRTYAREIVPAFNAYLYFKFGYWVSRRLVHLLYRVRLGFSDDASLTDLDESSSVVFLMNHRSNMDYILATYLAAERTTLSYAVGEWARVWPLQQLIRLMGGYFVRRNSKDPLYRKVLECYVQMAAAGGVPQAVFPEGGLSRDGKLGQPKLGLLSYIVKDFDPKGERDIVFVPVGLNYDRVLEDRTLLRMRQKSNPRATRFFTLSTSLKFFGKNIWLALTGRWYRNGYACVNFGTPISLRDWLVERPQYDTQNKLGNHPVNNADGNADNHPENNPDKSADWENTVSELAATLMHSVGEIVPILPVGLVATVIARATQPLSELELKTRVFNQIRALEKAGRHVYIPRKNLDYAVDVGIRMLLMRRMVLQQEGLLSANEKEAELLGFYAASIAHLMEPVTAPPDV